MNERTPQLLALLHDLSQRRDRGQMLRRFLEAVTSWVPGLGLRLLGDAEVGPADALPIATGEHRFGLVVAEGAVLAAEPGLRLWLEQAVALLAVVLENRLRAEQLETGNTRLDSVMAERTASLRQAMDEVLDLYDHAPCGYHSLDADGLVVRINDTELRWLGYARDEVEGRLRFDALLTPESRAKFERNFAAFVAGQGEVKDIELTLRRKDGTPLPVAATASALRDAQGRYLSSRSMVIDLTERKAAEARLRDAEQRAQQAQKLEAVGRLAGGVAHDFNNLLTVILSGTEALQEGLSPADARWEDLRDVRETAERAAVLTRQLLTFSRRQPALASRVDVTHAVDNLERMLRRLIGEDVHLETARWPQPLWVDLDVGQLEQAVVNLVVNARDAMPDGGRLTLETFAVTPAQAAQLQLPEGNGWVCLAVHDTGTGMDGATLSRLFEPFFTTKEPGRGTGLGLATVYGVVKNAGGEVRVDSAVGQGSHFRLYLPAAEAPGPTVEVPLAAPRARVGQGVVLLVEDEVVVRRNAARALRACGYVVLEAGDGVEALEVARPYLPAGVDVVVTDVVMPTLGGRGLAHLLRASAPRLPVLYVSGYPERAVPATARPGERQACLQKPYTAARLTEAVQALLAT